MMIINLLKLLWPITYVVGLYVSLKYYRACGKLIFTMLLFYFAMGIYSTTLAPHVNRLIASRHTSEFTAEQLERYQSYQEELNILHIQYPEIAPGTLVKVVSFPFGQILLVIILALIGKQLKKIAPNHGLESTGAPPAAGTPETHP